MTIAELEATAKQGALLSLQTYVDANAANSLLLFNNAYDAWKQSKDNHGDAFTDPMPVPPQRGHVAVGSDGWPVLSWGPDLVAPIPVYTPPGPAQQPPMTALVGAHLYDDTTTTPPTSWYQCLGGDTWPTSQPPNSIFPVTNERGVFVKISYPFGSWYKKIG